MSIQETAYKNATTWKNIRYYQLHRIEIEKKLTTTKEGTTRPANLKYPEVDQAMAATLDDVQQKGANISGRLLRYTAQKYAMNNNIEGFRASNGWLRNFCHRHNQAFKVLQGKLPDVLLKEEYSLLSIQNSKYNPTVLRFLS